MSARNTLCVVARPAVHEVAIVAVEAGELVRVLHPFGFRDYRPDAPHVETFAVVPGDRSAIGWGWSVGWYGSLMGVRNGHHELDRDAWHAATRALRVGGIAYVSYVLRLWHGKPRWTANGYRWEPASKTVVGIAEKTQVAS